LPESVFSSGHCGFPPPAKVKTHPEGIVDCAIAVPINAIFKIKTHALGKSNSRPTLCKFQFRSRRKEGQAPRAGVQVHRVMVIRFISGSMDRCLRNR
jgi:hypothetical protein